MLHDEIAAGGMATVRFGRLLGPVGFSRTVAIKCLHPQFAKDPEFAAMFLDEARLAARVRHPNVIPILDVVALDGELFLVMEYVQGESLSKLLRVVRHRKGRVPLRITANVMSGVLEGLHSAHDARSEQGEALGIVHRDVSPQNIIVGLDGVARVLDFGVAKAAGRLQSTRDGQLKGKLAYMAPEQLRGGEVDRRTDLYAASVVLWECLTGQRLFKAEDEVAIFGQVLEGKIEPPSSVIPTLPKGYDEVAMRGLQRDPAKRWQTAQEMAIALEKVAGVASPREVSGWVEQLAKETLAKRAERIAEIESVSSVSLAAYVTSNAAVPAQATVVQPSASPNAQGTPEGAPTPRNPTPVPAVPPPPESVPQQSLPTTPPDFWAPASAPYAPPQPRIAGTDEPSSAVSDQPVAPSARSGLLIVAGIVSLASVVIAFSAIAFALYQRPHRSASLPGVRAAVPSATSVPDPEPAVLIPEAGVVEPPDGDTPRVLGTSKGVGTGGSWPTGTRTPAPATTAAPPPTPKADCNPPYTIDARGHRVPKRDCL